MVTAGCASVLPQLNCTHEEADDRMMFHVQNILSRQSRPTSMTLLSGDTYFFVCLLYHFTVSWRDLGLQELWLIHNAGMRREILQLHNICSALGNNLIKCLPAVHALTGCDITSKIATKSAVLNTVTNARKHIYRAYYQVQLWVQAPFRDVSFRPWMLRPV